MAPLTGSCRSTPNVFSIKHLLVRFSRAGKPCFALISISVRRPRRGICLGIFNYLKRCSDSPNEHQPTKPSHGPPSGQFGSMTSMFYPTPTCAFVQGRKATFCSHTELRLSLDARRATVRLTARNGALTALASANRANDHICRSILVRTRVFDQTFTRALSGAGKSCLALIQSFVPASTRDLPLRG